MKLWMASLLLALAGTAQASDSARFTATVDGRLSIGPEGQVLDVQLEDAGWMGEAVVEGYLQKIRGWRFEPILEDGKPVTASSPMQLRLAALRDDAAKTAHFAIEHATFFDPEQSRQLLRGFTRRPAYPDEAVRFGVGAQVMLLVRVDDKGIPQDIAVEYLHLSGRDVGSHGKRLASQFERTSLAAARRWRLEGANPEGMVRVPIKYIPPAFSPPRTGWERVYPMPVEKPDWLEKALAVKSPVLELADNGRPSKLRLLTPLDPLLGG